MRLYWYGLLMLIKKFCLRQNTGKVVCEFAEQMGVVYIKVAQILAMQNIGQVFTEADRQKLAQICDHCNPIKFAQVEKILVQEYGPNYRQKFRSIDERPLGSASISQVHRAVLQDGTEVVLKIKRQDVTRHIEKDIWRIHRIIHRFGKFAQFKNFFGSDQALEYYMNWIFQETDFANERHNIERYQKFAKSVNGKIPQVQTEIVLPQLFPELCTDNIIVMEYICHPTINQLPMTPENQRRVAQAENDYIKLSFYALFHGMPVVFHGDPHGGNLYLDAQNRLGFLDLGLIFEFTVEEAQMTRQLFLDAYTGKVEKIVELLFAKSQFERVDREQLTADMKAKVQELHQIPVPQFFVEMMLIFTQHDIAPPEFLFKMAKAFLALYGLGTIMENRTGTETLLAQQVIDYYIQRTGDDIRGLCYSGLQLVPNFFKTSLQQGFQAGIVEQFTSFIEISNLCQTTLQNCHEVVELFQSRWRG